MLNDIESLMDDMLEQLKVLIPSYITKINTEKEDIILKDWQVHTDAYFLDVIKGDFPPYKASLLLYTVGSPSVISHEKSFDCIETYTLGLTVILADDFKDTFFRVKKRFNRILKNVITKDFVRRYNMHSIKYLKPMDQVIISPNGAAYVVADNHFAVTIVN